MSGRPSESLRNHFDRPAEKLVLRGYRQWTRGTALRSMEPWRKAQRLYRDDLGDRDAEVAIIALADFVKTLGQCAVCPLRVFRPDTEAICSDELHVLGLIAGIQNCDQGAINYCLHRLCCDDLCDQVATAAASFALTLRSLDRRMRPLPAPLIARMLADMQDGSGSYVLH